MVKVGAAGINFSDIGMRRVIIGHDIRFPHILGAEGAGRVVELGAGVGDFVPANVSLGPTDPTVMPSALPSPPRLWSLCPTRLTISKPQHT